jgi:predicted MFS family arabinose efflux permease
MPRYRRDIFYRGSLLKAGALLSGNHSASCPDIFVHSRRRKQSGGICFHLRGYFRGVLPLLRDSIDLSIFKSLIFILFCIHSMFLYLSYDIPYMYLPAHAEMIGVVSGWASFLISIIGIASTVGQIVMGYIGDRPAVDRVLFYIAMTFTAGAATLFVPLLSSYGTLAIYSAVYGFFISANFALTTIIVVELLGMDQLTNAYGFVSLAEGLANLVGLPLAGWLTDSVGGSYNPSFFASGAIICCSALMLLFVPCLRRCDHIATVNDKSDGSESTSYDAAMMLSDGKPVEANDHTSSSNHTTDFL